MAAHRRPPDDPDTVTILLNSRDVRHTWRMVNGAACVQPFSAIKRRALHTGLVLTDRYIETGVKEEEHLYTEARTECETKKPKTDTDSATGDLSDTDGEAKRAPTRPRKRAADPAEARAAKRRRTGEKPSPGKTRYKPFPDQALDSDWKALVLDGHWTQFAEAALKHIYAFGIVVFEVVEREFLLLGSTYSVPLVRHPDEYRLMWSSSRHFYAESMIDADAVLYVYAPTPPDKSGRLNSPLRGCVPLARLLEQIIRDQSYTSKRACLGTYLLAQTAQTRGSATTEAYLASRARHLIQNRGMTVPGSFGPDDTASPEAMRVAMDDQQYYDTMAMADVAEDLNSLAADQQRRIIDATFDHRLDVFGHERGIRCPPNYVPHADAPAQWFPSFTDLVAMHREEVCRALGVPLALMEPAGAREGLVAAQERIMRDIVREAQVMMNHVLDTASRVIYPDKGLCVEIADLVDMEMTLLLYRENLSTWESTARSLASITGQPTDDFEVEDPRTIAHRQQIELTKLQSELQIKLAKVTAQLAPKPTAGSDLSRTTGTGSTTNTRRKPAATKTASAGSGERPAPRGAEPKSAKKKDAAVSQQASKSRATDDGPTSAKGNTLVGTEAR